jgi:2-dehydro-3-deoxygalactonokinase
MHTTFLSCDWGTSSFRLRLVEAASGRIIASSFGEEGIAAAFALWKQPDNEKKERIAFYRSVIATHIKKIEQDNKISTGEIPVIISGMASSSIGMVELPYTALPFLLTGEDLQFKKIERTNEFSHELVILSGARTDADVIRGEETQLIGCAGNETIAQQIFIFTGTHSKHIVTAGGKAVSLSTYMTGEFFELLSAKSILSDSLATGAAVEDDEASRAFEQGVKDSRRQNLLHYSFMVRTNQLFRRFSKTANYFYLSGLLIGSELGQLPKKEMDAVTIVGDGKLVSNYRLALKLLDIDTAVTVVDAAAATIRGQLIMYKQVFDA